MRNAAVIAILLAALLGVQSGAFQQQQQQQQQQPPPPQPTFRTGVNFVRVDVYPTSGGHIVPDLTRNDFEVLEDGVLQRVETFERIVARAPVNEAERAEPRSIAESNDAAADPRNRLFVLFFDTLHSVGYRGAHQSSDYDPRIVGRALATFLDKLIGPDDLIGMMRPEMPVEALSFTRRPSSFLEYLSSGAEWQKRFLEGEMDDRERMYEGCYPPGSEDAELAGKMIVRRRELLMMGALQSLVTHLGGLREGRKSVLVVSEGWTLFGPDDSLARPTRTRGIPGPPPIGVDRGQPTLGDPRQGNVSMSECERDRLLLARLDDEKDFRRMLDDANRYNVTFYPVDLRGLSVESPFNRRSDSLATLATATDGILVSNSNDVAPGLRRIADDVSSYYLLGYYSNNSKADGSFRKITVRVKRPGVAIRARRGYLAPTEAEMKAAMSAAAPPDPQATMRDGALQSLATVRADRPLHLAAGYGWDLGGPAPRPVLWIAGEIDLLAARRMPWSSGGDAAITVMTAGGQALLNDQSDLPALAPRFLRRVANAQVTPGEYTVRLRVRGKLGNDADAAEMVRVAVPDPAKISELLAAPALLFRRGPYSGSGFQPTADSRFRKAERVRVDVPLRGAVEAVTARLLDRKGQPLPIPATAAVRDDDGWRFASAEVALAPLAQGDYLVELAVTSAGKNETKLVAFRVVP